MRIVITGAAGDIASQLVEELQSSHELRLIDRRWTPARSCVIADLKRTAHDQSGSCSSPWAAVFEGADAVFHLAANSQATASWPEVLGDNVDATWNVLEAAAAHRVPRVIFASTNWVVKALERKLAPDCYRADGPKIGSEIAPCPVNPYGLSKALGETAGRMFVDQGRLAAFVAVRIGYYDPLPVIDPALRSLWIGANDMRALLRKCVETSFDGYHVIYAVSAQPSAPYDLSHTESLLSWTPKQVPPGICPKR